jgi:dTMP kinase
MSRFYLALEGGEGAGKTTVVRLLEEALADRGETVLTVREPGSTELGDEIRRLVLHWRDMSPWAETMLFAAQRAQLVAEVVRPALEQGHFVISDRSLYSSLAYQGGARRLGVDLVREVNEIAVGGTLPDLVAVLMVDLSTGLSRQADPDRIGREHDAFQEQVTAAYGALAAAEPDRVVLVAVEDGPEKVAARILELIDDRRG